MWAECCASPLWFLCAVRFVTITGYSRSLALVMAATNMITVSGLALTSHTLTDA